MLNIYSFPGTRGVRVTWAVEELGTEYEYKIVNLYQGEHKQPAFLAAITHCQSTRGARR